MSLVPKRFSAAAFESFFVWGKYRVDQFFSRGRKRYYPS
jgi:hypothetical protein